MTFEATTDAAGVRHCFVDGVPVPGAVYDTLYPSKLFPAETGLTEAEALAAVETIKAGSGRPGHRGPYFHNAISDARPLRSEALAVHTSQIPAVLARNKRHGVNVEYDRKGRPVFRDAGQRKALMKLEGVRKMNSYNGD